MSDNPRVEPRVDPATARVPGLALVRLLAPVVPRRRRAEWVAEWRGELDWAAAGARRRGEPAWLTALRLNLRGLGATTDALWLRHHDGVPAMLGLDLRYAARALRRRPGFTLVVVLTLALGIGATTAIFSVVNGVLLRPLDFPDPERLVTLGGEATDGNAEKVSAATSYPDYRDFRARARSFAELAALRTWTATLTARDVEPARLEIAYATSNFFRALGTLPALGRAFTPDDARPGAPDVAVLSFATWRARFGGDPGIVGRSITLDGRPVTVVGVTPPNLGLARDVALWRPLVPGPLDEARGAHRLTVIGRLRAGVPLATARAEARAIARALEREYPADNAHRGARLDALQENLVAPVRPALLVLLAAVTLVLVVGCANLASLLLARAAGREREVAVRAALGASRGHLLRHWMSESLLLAAGGGAAGAAVAWVGMRALLALAPRTIPRADEVALDAPVLLFLLGVSALTGLLFGALPALQHWRGHTRTAALHDARGASADPRPRRARQGLVVAEVAITTVLVTSAALLLQELHRLTRVELGFRPEGMAVVHLQLPETRYDSAHKVLRFYERFRESAARVPGVALVSLAYEHPLGEGWTSSFVVAGRPAPAPGSEPEAAVRPVAPGYFRAAGVRLLRGRDVTERDRFGAPGVVVVNEAFARRHFPGASPIGQRIDRRDAWWPGQPTTFEIVGVVADEPFMGPGAAPAPALYYPHAQFPMNDMWVVVRGARADVDLTALGPALQAAVWAIDPNLPVERVRAMREVVSEASAEPRFNALLLALFAGAALLLAAVGIYGVMSYTVARRTREIGVRIALGAGRGRVVRQVVGEGGAVAALGVALGVPGALAAGRVLATTLSGVRSADPAVLAGVATTLLIVGVSAAWVPAWRASRVDPAAALRAD